MRCNLCHIFQIIHLQGQKDTPRYAKPEYTEALIQSFDGLKQAPGYISHECYRDIEDKNKLTLVEKWGKSLLVFSYNNYRGMTGYAIIDIADICRAFASLFLETLKLRNQLQKRKHGLLLHLFLQFE